MRRYSFLHAEVTQTAVNFLVFVAYLSRLLCLRLAVKHLHSCTWQVMLADLPMLLANLSIADTSFAHVMLGSAIKSWAPPEFSHEHLPCPHALSFTNKRVHMMTGGAMAAAPGHHSRHQLCQPGDRLQAGLACAAALAGAPS